MFSEVIALDICSKKTIAVLAKRYRQKYVQILAKKELSSDGIRNGIIEDPLAVTKNIKSIFKDLHFEHPNKVENICVSISNRFIRMQKKEIECNVKNGKILHEHIDELYQQARNSTIEKKTKIVQSIIDEYIIDNQKIIHIPLGLNGHSLKAVFSQIYTQKSILDTMKKCIEKDEFILQKIFVKPIVSTPILITNHDKSEGISLLDFGDEATSLAVYYEGVLQHLSVLPFGINHVLKDIQTACKIDAEDAILLLDKFSKNVKEELIILPPKNGNHTKEISVITLKHIVKSRLNEIVDGIKNQIIINKLERKIVNGIVLTGHHTDFLYLPDILNETLKLDIAINKPLTNYIRNTNIELNNSKYNSIIGMLYQIFDIGKNPIENGLNPSRSIKRLFGSLFVKN